MPRGVSDSDSVIQARRVNKQFPGVTALSDFDFELRRGEVHCLIGENGAGKSTFIKILSGVYRPSAGEIEIDGESYHFLTTQLVRGLGIQTVYQEDILVPQITAAENIFLGSRRNKNKLFVRYRELIRRSGELAEEYGIELDVTRPYEQLNPSDQQFTKILKTLAQSPRVLILDEPTQVFNVNDTELVINIVKRISREGVSVIYIAHNLDEIIKVADRVTVLRDGLKIITHDASEEKLDTPTLAKEMVGRPVNLFYKKKKHPIGDTVLEVRGLKLKDTAREMSFSVREGEVLGIAGLKGAGRSEIARAIFGAREKKSGTVIHKGREITPKSPIDAVKNGIALLTEDKKIDGLFMGMPVFQNITMVGLETIGRFLIRMRQEKNAAREFVDRLNIKTPSLDQDVKFLCGGHQ